MYQTSTYILCDLLNAQDDSSFASRCSNLLNFANWPACHFASNQDILKHFFYPWACVEVLRSEGESSCQISACICDCNASDETVIIWLEHACHTRYLLPGRHVARAVHNHARWLEGINEIQRRCQSHYLYAKCFLSESSVSFNGKFTNEFSVFIISVLCRQRPRTQ